MKASFRLILATLAATVTLAGCVQEITPPNFENDKVAPAAEGSRVIAVSFAPQTKTYLGSDGLQPKFNDKDSILISNGEAIDTCEVDVNGDEATISTNLTGPLTAVYPYKAAGMSEDNENQIDTVLVSTVQSGKFADANICMARMKGGKDESLSFENKTAVFCIYPPTDNPEYVEVSAKNSNIANNVPTGSTHTSLEIIHVSTTTADSVWVSILVPKNLTVGNLTFSDGTKVKTVTDAKAATEIEAGALYTVTKEGWIVPVPILVRAGDDLQAAIDSAEQFQEIRVEGGAKFTSPSGGIRLGGNNVNKTISGGWNSDFTEQSMDNLSQLDGSKDYGFWCAENDNSPMNGYVNISYFEVYNCEGNHGTAFHCVGGPITISNCYVHDNISEKGAIGTNEGGYQTVLNVVNCIVSNNTANAHGAAFGFGEGKSDSEPVKATLVGNLIVDNVSTKKDGYTSTFICYNQTELIFVNNTVVGNKNWAEYGGPYSGMILRGDVCSVFANNIMVGNLTSPCTREMVNPVYEPQDGFLNMGGSFGTLVNNIYEGSIKDVANATVRDQIDFPLGANISEILSSDYKPVGVAVDAGTLDSVSYAGNKAGPYTLDVKALLETYPIDLAGNPRIVDGKVNIGCY